MCGVRTVCLSFTKGLEGLNLRPLQNAHYVDLSHSDVTDVSALAGVPLLRLQNCKKLADVSPLGGNRELDLSDCCQVRDVSSLGRVRKLSLASTPVSDISALGAVHSLSLAWCRKIKAAGFAVLGNNHYLDLTGTAIRDADHLGRVHYLALDQCRYITSVRELAGKNAILRALTLTFRRQAGQVVATPTEERELYDGAIQFAWER